MNIENISKLLQNFISGNSSWEYLFIACLILILLKWILPLLIELFIAKGKLQQQDHIAYAKIKEGFTDNTVRFLTEHDFGGSFERNRLSTLDTLYETSDLEKPEYNFSHKNLKELSNRVQEAIITFYDVYLVTAFPCDGNSGWSHTPKNNQGQYLKDPKPLNNKARQLINEYNALNKRYTELKRNTESNPLFSFFGRK